MAPAPGSDSGPLARITTTTIRDLDLQSATLVFDVEVSNPYPEDLFLTGIDYRVGSLEQQILEGNAGEISGPIRPGGSRVYRVPARISFPELLSNLGTVKPGAVVPYAAELVVKMVTPLAIEGASLTLNREGEFPVPAPPEVELISVEWKELSLQRAAAAFQLKVINKNAFAMDLTRIAYGLSFGLVRVLDTRSEHEASFGAGEEKTIDLQASFSTASLGLAGLQLLLGTGAQYRLGGTMSFQTPFGLLELPYERTGETVFKR
jgi:LEA14-like dessication related protein